MGEAVTAPRIDTPDTGPCLILLRSDFADALRVSSTMWEDLRISDGYVSWREPQSPSHPGTIRKSVLLAELVAIVPRGIGGPAFSAIRQATDG